MNMKNTIRRGGALSIIMLMTVIIFAGCGKKATPQNLLSDMAKNIKEVKSIDASIGMGVTITNGSETMKVTADVESSQTMNPKATYNLLSMNIEVGGMSIDNDMEAEMYQVEEDGENVVYTLAENNWSKEVGGDYKSMTDLFIGIKGEHEAFELKEEIVKVNDKDCFEIIGELDGDLLVKMLSEGVMESLTSGMGLNTDTLKDIEIPCEIDVYKDSILPARIHLDMTDVGEKLYGDTLAAAGSISDYYLEATYEEYNKTDKIKVPKEAKNAAETDEGFDWNSGLDEEDDKPEAKAAEQGDKLGDSWDSFTVQVNDKVITLPCSIADLEAAGLTLDEESTPLDTVIEPDDVEFAYFNDDNGNTLMIDMLNSSAGEKQLKDCLVSGIGVYDHSLKQGGLTVVFPGGIKIGDSLEGITEKYGEAASVYEGEVYHMYAWYKDGTALNNCKIDLEADSGKVYYMYMSRYE